MSYLQPTLTQAQAWEVRKWIDALRSGKYEQGRRYLHKDGKYCCLGVAGEVCGVKRCNAEALEDASAREILGMIDGSGDSSNSDYHLTTINDAVDEEFHRDFNGIADLLEESLSKAEVIQ